MTPGSAEWIDRVTRTYRDRHGFLEDEAPEGSRRRGERPDPMRLGIPPLFRRARPKDFPGVALEPERRRSVLIFGGTGTGKSHAAAALALRWGLRWTFVPDLMVRLRRTFRPHAEESEAQIVDALVGASGIVLDDLFAGTRTDYGLGTLFLVNNGRIENGRITVVTCDRDLAAIDAIDSGLASRLASFSRVRLHGPDRRPLP